MKDRWIALAAALSFAGLAAPVLAQSPDPALARLPADATTVLVVRDVLPPLEKLLASPPVAALLKATGDLQQEAFGLRFDAAGLIQQINLFRNYVPVSAGIGMSDASRDALVAIVRAGVQTALLLQSRRVEEVPEPWTEQLHDELADALAAVSEPSLVAWLVLRDERTAEQWFDTVVEAVQPLDRDEAVEVAVVDATLTLQLDVLRLEGQRLGKLLAASGAPVPKEFALRITVQLVQDGAELRLRVGAPSPGPLAKDRMGPLWSEDPAQVLSSRVDLVGLAEALATDVEYGKALASVDGGRSFALAKLVAQLEAAALQMERLAVVSEGAIRIDDGVRFVTEADLGADLEDQFVLPDRLLRCVRAEEGPLQVSAVTLDMQLLMLVEQYLERAGRRGVPPIDVTGLHEFLGGESSAVFGGGTAFVARAASFRGAPGWTKGPMPFAAFAVLAVLGEGEDGQQFLRELGLRIGDLVDADGVLWEPKDLGLGVPTQALRLGLLPAPFGEGIDADFSPHWLVCDGVLVFSTDLGLSRDLIGRLRDASPAPVSTEGRRVDWQSWRSDHLAAALDGGSRWLEAMGTMRDIEQLQQWMPLVTACVRALDRFEWITELDGQRLRERFDLRFARRSDK
ncbi:MAG: hypothetical protein JNL12_23545 [Planctomycetes bacterium]|nr:hypothetical protein [Planctomycetota bacterium]